MNNEYYIIEGGEKKGPYTFNELINMEIDIYTEISVGVDKEAVYASYLPELSEYFEDQGYIFPTEGNVANIGWRILAFVIDYVIISIIVMTCLVNFGLLKLPASTQLTTAEALKMFSSKDIYNIEICLAAVFLLYNIIFESTLRGSIGKLICGLKVVDEDGQKLSLVKTLLRNIGAITALNMIGLIIVTISFFYKEVNQTWYERLTKTYVIKP